MSVCDSEDVVCAVTWEGDVRAIGVHFRNYSRVYALRREHPLATTWFAQIMESLRTGTPLRFGSDDDGWLTCIESR
jgi:hypothetical protein